MMEAEYSHEGDRCTFEVLISHLEVPDHGLFPIAEIIHDLDFKDGKFHRAEAAGLGVLLNGIVAAYPSDKERVERGGEIFNALYEYFLRQK